MTCVKLTRNQCHLWPKLWWTKLCHHYSKQNQSLK